MIWLVSMIYKHLSGTLYASAPAEKFMRKSAVFMSHQVLEPKTKKTGTEAALHEPWFRGTVEAVRQTVCTWPPEMSSPD
jgi:hypothetical protein